MPVRRSHIVSTDSPGILGVRPSDPEVVGVYPQLSATVIPHAQEIRLRRGDSLDIPVQVQNEKDPPDPVSIGGGVLRWAAKQSFGTSYHFQLFLGNETAFVVKRSYDPLEIEFTDATSGRAVVHVGREDTLDMPTAPAVWDLELTLPTEQIDVPSGATAEVLSGSDIVTTTGAGLTSLGVRAGDLIEVQGRRVLVLSVFDDRQLRVDFTDWDTASKLPFALYRGNTKTLAAGRFSVLGDVVV